jgi:hypothetical protein
MAASSGQKHLRKYGLNELLCVSDLLGDACGILGLNWLLLLWLLLLPMLPLVRLGSITCPVSSIVVVCVFPI